MRSAALIRSARADTEAEGGTSVRKLFVPAKPDQVGVVPYRIRDGEIEILLITARSRGRWVIPKGGIQPGCGLRGSARNEAYEEAGIAGQIGSKPIGCYRHGQSHNAALVQVFLMRVDKEAESWPEQGQRRCQWMPLEEAVERVSLQGLRAILEETATLLRLSVSTSQSAKSARHPAIPPATRA